MKNRIETSVFIGIALLIALVLGSAGCESSLLHPTSTPAIFDGSRPIQDRIASGERIYTATIKQLTALRKAGAIDDATQRDIAAIRKQAAVAFDAAHLFADANDVDSAKAQIDLIQSLLDKLTEKLTAAQKKGG